MVDPTTLRPEDLKALSADAVTQLATEMLVQLASQARQIEQQQEAVQRREAEIRFKDAKLEKVTFELARLKAWKFAARTERMSAVQRQMFEETAAEDEADLEAQLQALQGPPEVALEFRSS
jgi:transposase